MNKEIEIKVKLDNKEVFLSNLQQQAKFQKEINQRDIYFIMPQANFFQEQPIKRYLRLRSSDKGSSFDYHFCNLDKDNKLLWTDEYETGVVNPEMMVEILTVLYQN